jgi:class 3 adenylate cyclase
LNELVAPLVTALVSLGMALAFFSADPHSPTSRALALTLAAISPAILGEFYLRPFASGGAPSWSGWLAISEVVAFCAVFEWILRVRRTIPTQGMRTRFGDLALRVAQGLALLYGVLSILFPQTRASVFLGGLTEIGRTFTLDFLMFSLPLELAMLLAGVSIVLALNRRPDRAERVRLIALCVAIPVTASGLVLPREIAPLVTVLGLIAILVGSVRYHVLQGERGLFMSRFLSPQVATLVRERGLRSVMRDTSLELSIVCCDLRGFTAFAERRASEEVISVLRAYYDAVGEVATAIGGTIKDYAGDGILLLVGAPLQVPDHHARAIELAAGIRARVRTLLFEQGAGQDRLGVGVGVASGRVTVGIVGGAGRLEYAAVGPAVNLASRLCELAAADEIVIAQRTVELLDSTQEPHRFQPRPPASLKGIGEAVPSFALAASL